ncbi:hypothetical protein GCM10009681_06420 [Luedemannella helvata]|uniref:Peptidase C14 caspase domain-containing protein n=1 Tax=Luedemannella helvata TaxID=349315 RepID=A0ABP4VVW6_9ACTN
MLIGAQTGGLTGVVNDVDAMDGALSQWGFEVARCEGDQASRAGILDAYEGLIADAGADDAVFVYYSGHGGYCRPPDYERAIWPRAALQFIVPSDYAASTEGDFRGITSIELSVLLGRLTQKTRNVTVTLDCCHAALMSRDSNLRVRAQTRPASYEMVADHLESLRARGARFDRWSPTGNQNAVRVVACAPDQAAYEYANRDGVQMGILTESLTMALAEARALPVTWSTVVEQVRDRVLLFVPTQRPEAEGPSRRLLFDTVEADPIGTLPAVSGADGRVCLKGGPLLGVRVGDEFTIMPADSVEPQETTRIGDVTIDRVDALAAYGPLRPSRNVRSASVPLGARAHPTRLSAPSLAVRIPVAGAGVAELRQAIVQSTHVRLAETGEPCPIEVRADPAGLIIVDAVGPLTTPEQPDAAGISSVLTNLRRLAQAELMRRLSDDPQHALAAPVTIEFGVVNNGEFEPLEQSGAIVSTGQRICLRVRNEGTETVYLSVLDVGVAGRISLLTNAAPSGVRLDAGKMYVFGGNDFTGVLQGAELTWPEGLDRSQPRPETIQIVLMSAPHELWFVQNDGVRSAGPTRYRSTLENVVGQIRTGGYRDLTGEPRPSVRYAVHTVDFTLLPVRAAVAEEATFQVDERPDPSFRLFVPRSAAPQKVAVRLSDLVVHRNRAFGSADIRIDTLVLTRDADGQPSCEAHTERFHNIRDDQRLPLDRMQIFNGSAADFLDLAVWVSRDSADSLALSDLLKEKLTDGEVQAAFTQLGGMLTAAPQVAVAVAAISASAIVVNAAYHLLRGAVGDSIGLYRTTFLAHERFGVGRLPAQNTVRAQDFTFTYAIEDVG